MLSVLAGSGTHSLMTSYSYQTKGMIVPGSSNKKRLFLPTIMWSGSAEPRKVPGQVCYRAAWHVGLSNGDHQIYC